MPRQSPVRPLPLLLTTLALLMAAPGCAEEGEVCTTLAQVQRLPGGCYLEATCAGERRVLFCTVSEEQVGATTVPYVGYTCQSKESPWQILKRLPAEDAAMDCCTVERFAEACGVTLPDDFLAGAAIPDAGIDDAGSDDAEAGATDGSTEVL